MTAAFDPGHRRGRHALPWAYVGLALFFLYLPLVPPILFSVGEGEQGGAAFTLGWYGEIWSNPVLLAAMETTVEVGLVVALATTLLGLLSAMAIRELGVPRLVLLLVLLPLFIPGVSMGLAGAFFLNLIGVDDPFIAIAIVQVLWALPFAALVITTAMSNFDPAYLEAAYMSGANRLRTFLDIELPIIWPGITGAATFSLILSFNETVRTAIVQGPLNTVQTYIWSTYKQVGLSPAIYALISLLIIVSLALVGVLLAAGRVWARREAKA